MADTSIEKSTSENRFIIHGLNFLIIPKGQQELCPALSIALSFADLTGFVSRGTGHGVLFFSLENNREETEQMLARYNDIHENITVIYAYEEGAFGDKIEDGLNVFLQDNPRIKMVVVDSLEKILESETGKVEYGYAYKKLCAIKNVADKHDAILLVVTHTKVPENSRLASVADTVLDINKNGRQNGNEYTLHVAGKNISEKEITITFEPERYSWKPVTTK